MQSSEMPRPVFHDFSCAGKFLSNFGRQILEKDDERKQTHENNNSPQICESPAVSVARASVRGSYSLAFAPQPVHAGPSYPFNANFIANFESVLEFPLLHVTVNASGEATYMKRPSAHTDDQLVNLIDGSLTATYTLTPASRMANGGSGPIQDTLVLTLVVPGGGTIITEGGFLFSGSYTITGGTGHTPALPAAAFLGDWASILRRPMVSALLPSRARSRFPPRSRRLPWSKSFPRASLSCVCVSEGKRWRDPLPAPCRDMRKHPSTSLMGSAPSDSTASVLLR